MEPKTLQNVSCYREINEFLKGLILRIRNQFSIYQVNSYRSGQVHNKTKNRILYFRLFLSAIGTPNYKLAKLAPLIESKYFIIDPFYFAKDLCKQNPNLYMN